MVTLKERLREQKIKKRLKKNLKEALREAKANIQLKAAKTRRGEIEARAQVRSELFEERERIRKAKEKIKRTSRIRRTARALGKGSGTTARALGKGSKQLGKGIDKLQKKLPKETGSNILRESAGVKKLTTSKRKRRGKKKRRKGGRQTQRTRVTTRPAARPRVQRQDEDVARGADFTRDFEF